MGIASKLGGPAPAANYQQGTPQQGAQPSGPFLTPQQSGLAPPSYGVPQQNNSGQSGYPPVNYGAPGQAQLYPQIVPPSQYPPSQYQQPAQMPGSQYPQQPSSSQYPGGDPGPAMQPQFFMDVESVRYKLSLLISQNQLQSFYGPPATYDLARQVAQKDLMGLARHWRLPGQMVLDLVGLSLYDTVVLCDDSGSMRLSEGGERIRDLQAILERVSSVCGLFDLDGISIHTMNGPLRRDGVTNPQIAGDFVRQIRFEGATPLGTMLERKILQPHVYQPVQQGSFRKPVHVIVITDGEPTAEPPGEVKAAIKRAKAFLKASRFGAGAVAFQFAQVGTDPQAQAFLGRLDTDARIGKMVDCTSSYEQEQAEYIKQSGIDLTPDMYINKLCLGAIDRSYDEQDEAAQKKGGFLKKLFA